VTVSKLQQQKNKQRYLSNFYLTTSNQCPLILYPTLAGLAVPGSNTKKSPTDIET